MLELVVLGVVGIVGYLYYDHKKATATPQPPTLPSTAVPQAAPAATAPAAQQAAAAAQAAAAQSGAAPLLVLPTGQGTGVLDPVSAAAAASAAAQSQAAQAAAAQAAAAGASPAEQQAAAVAAAAKVAESLKNQAADAALAMGNRPEATAALLALSGLPVFGSEESGVNESDFGQNHASQSQSNMSGRPRGFGSVNAAAQAAAAHAQKLARSSR